jgi:hypothetical protein
LNSSRAAALAPLRLLSHGGTAEESWSIGPCWAERSMRSTQPPGPPRRDVYLPTVPSDAPANDAMSHPAEFRSCARRGGEPAERVGAWCAHFIMHQQVRLSSQPASHVAQLQRWLLWPLLWSSVAGAGLHCHVHACVPPCMQVRRRPCGPVAQAFEAPDRHCLPQPLPAGNGVRLPAAPDAASGHRRDLQHKTLGEAWMAVVPCMARMPGPCSEL